MNDYGKVSVLMGIYNCEDTLGQSIESIFNQTYQNWELILCDDGSTDNTYEVAEKYATKEKRIILLRNNENKGLNTTLNNCLKYASGEYIARMDGDDDCLKDRFKKQVEFLNSQNQYDIVSSWMSMFDENGNWGLHKVQEYPSVEDVICGSPICHAPVMMRKECMDKVSGYTEDKKMLRVEDVNLWIKLYREGYRCYNIQEPLYKMRNDKNAFNRRKYKYRINSTYVRLQGCRMFKLGVKCYIKAFMPMVIGVVPTNIRHYIRKQSYNKV